MVNVQNATALLNTPATATALAGQTGNASNAKTSLDVMGTASGTAGNVAGWAGNLADLGGATGLAKGLGGAGAVLSTGQLMANAHANNWDLSKTSTSDALGAASAGLTAAALFPTPASPLLGFLGLLTGFGSAAIGLLDDPNNKFTVSDLWNHYFGDDPQPQTSKEWSDWLQNPDNQRKVKEWLDKQKNPAPYRDGYGDFPFPNKDWKDLLDPNNWRDKPNRQGKHYYYDPIVLDLDGDGIETLAHNKNKGAMFDFDADGLKHATGWVKSDDGILVFDRNADGLINDGREVFGDSTLKADGSLAKHGFDALADLDTNADGYINQDDDAYKLLKVWQDKNQDGISQADELKTLEELNIQSLNLSYQDTKQNLYGDNQLAQIGSYTKTDGTSLKMGDVNFKFDSLYSQHSLAVDITDVQIPFLPNLAGGGRVRSLHEAMQLSAELKEIVVQYAQATTKQAQLELLPSLLKAWAKTDPEYQNKVDNVYQSVETNDGTGIAVTGPRRDKLPSEYMEKLRKEFKSIVYKVGILDSFLGTKTDSLYIHDEESAEQLIKIINTAYDNLSTAIYSGLYGQGGVFNHYNQYVQLHISFDDEQNIQYQLNFAPLIEHFQQKIATGDEQQLKTAFVDLIEYINYFQNQHLLPQDNLIDVKLLLTHISANITVEQQTEWLNAVNPHILKQSLIKFGTDKNERLDGTQENDYLYGGNGNDHLYSSSNNDILIGGLGNDYLDGGSGADTYIFSKGHGQDIILDYEWTAHNRQRPQDKIIFTDVRSDEIQIVLNGSDLIIKGYYEQDQITLKSFTNSDGFHIEQFQFTDKTVSFNELMDLVTATHQGTEQGTSQNTHYWIGKIQANLADGNDEFNSGKNGLGVIVDGGDGNDRIYTRNANDTIYGGAGNDYVEAKQGDDYIDGGDDNDTLYGQEGNDTLIGGLGNDYLDGGHEADTYIFSKGHGQDIVSDYDWTAPNGQRPQDKVIFTDVRSDEIQIELNGEHLIIKGYHEQDQITLRNFTHGSDYHIEQFEFVDKTVSLAELLSEHEISGTSNNDNLSFSNWNINVSLDGGDGNDKLYAGQLNDTLIGGLGNDYVEARQGDDYIDGGDGNDTLYGQDGSDTLIGGLGNDHLDGGYSADTYIFSKGHGQDTIYDYNWTSNNQQRPQDKITFTDVRSDEIQIVLNGEHLIIKGYHEQDQITLINFARSADYHIEQFEFADKTVSFSELMNLVTATHQGSEQGTSQTTYQWLGKVEANLADGNDEFNSGERGLGVIVDGGTGNDRIYTRNANDTIYGGNGNDYVEARQGDDYIDGGDGNDTLYGQDGSDTLIGGLGNDHLDGGYSADTYIFSKGHGQDTIHDYNWTSNNQQGPQDKITFTDVRSDEIQIELNGEHLLIKGYHEQDQVTLLNFTRGEHYHIEQFEFVDKTVSLTELLSEHKISGTSNNDHLSFSNWNINVSLDGGNGNDSLYGGQLNDTLIGGLGNDYLYGGNGADTAVLQMLDLTHHHIDYFADFNLKQGDKLDIRDLLEQPNQTIDLSNLSDYFSTEKTNDGMVLKFDQDGQYQDQHQSQAIMRFQSNAFDSLDQLIQANSFIL